MRKFILILVLIVLIVFIIQFFMGCGPKKPEITPQQLAEYNLRIKEADAYYDSGCYERLKQAFEVYREALKFPVYKRTNGEKLIKTALILGLREKELGFFRDTYLLKAYEIISEHDFLSDYSVYIQIASSIPRKTVGIVGGFTDAEDRLVIPFDEVKENISDWTTLLKEKSEIDDFFAYLTICCYSPFNYLVRRGPDLEKLGQSFPDSMLIRYKLSLFPEEDLESLKKLLQDEPAFYEAYFFLGNIHLKRKNLVKAEQNFLKAYPHFSQSLSLLISMGSIYFAFEEFEKSLEFHDKILEIASAHRDALLGKAICLSYMGRHKEAVDVCSLMLSLGEYYLGEAHYWLAWNQNELKQYEDAWIHIEKSKDYLMGYDPVFFLAGLVAFNQKRLDVAEENLKEAFKLNPSNGDAPYYLGKIKSIQEDWLNSKNKAFQSHSLVQWGGWLL